jgi:hypothetical protein
MLHCRLSENGLVRPQIARARKFIQDFNQLVSDQVGQQLDGTTGRYPSTRGRRAWRRRIVSVAFHDRISPFTTTRLHSYLVQCKFTIYPTHGEVPGSRSEGSSSTDSHGIQSHVAYIGSGRSPTPRGGGFSRREMYNPKQTGLQELFTKFGEVYLSVLSLISTATKLLPSCYQRQMLSTKR